ncbi:protocatechuate 3,4-dioxygenase subunit alpha [Neomegalonema perideroedes]|uniref:protocatechuate 3,4-dioxygenase subunit alpha n=1 Tax=Neomegalonema perideroedes TaxID=217219 RepID=UPI000371106E|nr:protocatechuate 3,4-dioxygenase subunit alpha [Neomegalonema perideroedes]
MQKLDYLKESPSQTAGPYVHIGLTPNKLGNVGIYPRDLGESPVSEGAQGERIVIVGTVRDGAGMILRDALIESWQADAQGLFSSNDPRGGADPKVSGWARIIADFDTGEWTLKTIKPGRVPFHDGRLMAPHISLWLVARGINLGLQTRIYFEDEENESCPVLQRIEHRERVKTLIAKKTGEGAYRFDVVLQGENETVFFDL